MLWGKLVPSACRRSPRVPSACRAFWGWLNAVFNKLHAGAQRGLFLTGSQLQAVPFQRVGLDDPCVYLPNQDILVDYDRIRAVGPDRAASEWLLRCGALVRYQGYEKWQQDYNGLPTGPLGKYKIEAINATESCIMYRGFDYLDGLEHVTEITLQKCIYIQDECLQRLSETKNLQKSLLQLKIISCGNVTDKGVIALHKLANLEYLFLSDLPGIRQKETTMQILQQALPNVELELDLE